MKSIKKLSALFLSLALTASAVAGAVPAPQAFADEPAVSYSDKENYYGKRLEDPDSKKFYEYLRNMDFKTGKSVSVTDSTLLKYAEAYARGDSAILKKFGAAVDSFRYDRTDLFYVDFDLLSLNIASKGGKYIMSIGAGRSDSYFIEGITADNVGEKITEYNAKVKAVSDSVTATGTEERAEAVSKAVAEAVEYSFESDNATTAPHIRTAYGAAVYGKAVCEGYARLYQAVMRNLGETCVLVNGWLSDNGYTEGHMWNYVLGENDTWYAVDPTVADDTTYNSSVVWARSDTFMLDHTEDQRVSTSGYLMPFPSIRAESAVLKGESAVEVEITKHNDRDCAVLTYEGKTVKELEADGKYLAFRLSITNAGAVEWTPWMTFQYCSNSDYAAFVDMEASCFYLDTLDKSKQEIQFAVLDANADILDPNNMPMSYSEEFFLAHVLSWIHGYENPENDPSFVAPPYVKDMTPTYIDLELKEEGKFHEVKVQYTSDLVFTHGNAPELEVTGHNLNAAANENDVVANISDYIEIKDVKFNGKDTVTFRFKPSADYAHNKIYYTFTLLNMAGKLVNGQNGKAPNGFSVTVVRKSYVCNRTFGDGRLYVDAYGYPSMVDNSDLSLNGWTYGDGQKVARNQRSQLALVVKNVAPEEETKLEDKVQEKADGAVKAAATYELNMNICKNIVNIPKGSFVKLSFGFPEGYGPDDAGVVFQVYHFKKDDNGNLDYDNPEVLDCVVTQYGLVVTVDSFSPFVVIAKERTAADNAKRGVVTAVNGVGGTVTTESKKAVNFLQEGESITYTLVPENGYVPEYVVLNGTRIEVSQDNTFTVKYSDLKKDGNTLTVGFASQKVLAAEKAENITNLTAEHAAFMYTYTAGTPAKRNLTALWVTLPIVLVCAGAAVGGYFLGKKLRAKADNKKRK